MKSKPLIRIFTFIATTSVLVLTLSALLGACQSTETSGNPEDQTAQSEPILVFTLVPPQEPAFIFGTAWDIYAEGPVDEGSAERLEALLSKHHIPSRSNLYLNVDGGDLATALALGRLIREAGLFAYVGSQTDSIYMAGPGLCRDAGALAFLGGPFRWVLDGSEVVFSPYLMNLDPEDLADYLVEMDIHTDLVELVLEQFSQVEEVFLSRLEMEALNVVHSGYEELAWTIEQLPQGLTYLKGERNTWRGVNKILIYCAPDGTGLKVHAIFDPEGREDEIMEMLNAHSLCLDGDYIPIPSDRLVDKSEANGWINVVLIWMRPFFLVSGKLAGSA
ncbi:MAG: hypothetical protein IPJ06_00435 [Saprospiraceae bacterium]|nr:hypothetical protein [Saprospiraceae bacterium]